MPQGQIWTNFIGVAYQLQDVTEEDGGFICIPGSHKYHPPPLRLVDAHAPPHSALTLACRANFNCPMDVRALEDDLGGSVRHIGMGKGDALIWTEALAHGTLPWRCAKTSAWLEFSSAAKS